MDNSQLIDIFINRSLIDQYLADDILLEVENSGKEVPEILADYEVIQDKDDIWPILANELGAELFDLTHFNPPPELLAIVPAGMARLHGALPVNFDSEGLTVCLVDPLSPQVVEDLRFALGKEIIIAIAPSHIVEKKLNDAYGGEGQALDEILSQLQSGAAKAGETTAQDVEVEANSAPIIRYVDLVLYQAINEGASDIHFEPFERDFKIRYRVDGALYEMAPPPIHLALPIISRVKVMSNMNIAEKRIPQDGRIVKHVGEKQVDMRVSTLPTQHGESVVLRVLDRGNINLSLDMLGMPRAIFDYINNTVRKPNGIFICTGPTGAGKTTTLYAALREINTVDAKLWNMMWTESSRCRFMRQ
jgi:type IV pilus assembly protein PilB